jgi:drug/metabolite transporter (DMT)-like permease
MLFGWLMLLPLFLVQHGWTEWAHISASGWRAIFYLGIGCSALGYLFWYGALQQIEVSRVAAFLYAQPLVTLAASAIFLREEFATTTIAGGSIVVASVILMQRARK